MLNKKGEAVIALVALGAIITLFVLYVTGHPISEKVEKHNAIVAEEIK